MSENKNNATLLGISLVIAAVIISGSVVLAGNQISNQIANVQLTVNNTGQTGGTAQAAPSPAPTPTAQAAPQQAAPSTPKMSALLDGAAGVLGDDDAPVTIIEFSDYQCPFCRRWYNDVKDDLVRDYVDTGKVKLVYKDLPLSFHPMAQPYAEAARCAGDQGKYWEFHDKIFDEQNPLGQGTITSLTETDIKSWAADLGLDTAAFDQCLDDGTHAASVQANFSEASGLGVSGTPSFIVGKSDGTGQLIVGAQPYSVFQNAVDGLLN